MRHSRLTIDPSETNQYFGYCHQMARNAVRALKNPKCCFTRHMSPNKPMNGELREKKLPKFLVPTRKWKSTGLSYPKSLSMSTKLLWRTLPLKTSIISEIQIEIPNRSRELAKCKNQCVRMEGIRDLVHFHYIFLHNSAIKSKRLQTSSERVDNALIRYPTGFFLNLKQ